MRNNLVPEQRVNKNGDTSTKWVRPGGTTSPGVGSIPPVTAAVDDNSLPNRVRVKDATMRVLHSRDVNHNKQEDMAVLYQAAGYEDIHRLRAMHDIAVNSDHELETVSSAYRTLNDAGIDNPHEYISPESLEAYLTIHKLLQEELDLMWSPSYDKRFTDVLSMVLRADDEDRPLIERVIRERSITNSDEIADMVREMSSNDAPALRDGTL